ncbi:TPA: restriction endonuclease subunit S [Streptococcus suis]|nr:restriction endonuclease subunit S [Streptococcus suis]
MKTNNNIPAYRFQGYTDAWELRKLGEVAEMYSGGTPSVGKKEFYEGNIPFIRSAEINSHNTELFLSELGLSNSSAKMVNKGDLLYALYGATSGEVGLAKISGAINQAILAIIPSIDYSSNFLLQWLKREKNNIIEKYLQGGQGNLSGAIVKDFSIMFPSLPEQEAIGTFFSTLDRHITLHQRKLDTLKEQKKTYLKLLFPAKAQTKPVLRFQGFEDDWEEVKLGEVVNIQKGTQRGKQEISEIQSEQFPYPVYNGGQNVSGYTDEYNRENMVIVSEGGASAGYVNYYSGKFWSGGHNFSIDNLDNNLLFIKSILEFNQQKLYELKVGSGLPNVQLGSINQFVLSLPILPEQEVIGTFFQTLDQEIAQVEDKLASLKEMKKTLLRKLFV